MLRGAVNLTQQDFKNHAARSRKERKEGHGLLHTMWLRQKAYQKPMKTLRRPRCGSVYKKQKKFILAVYICLLLFFMLAFAFIPDKMGILASAGSGIGAYIMFLWIVDTLNFDLLDAIILVAGFLIFGGLYEAWGEPLIAGLIAILFCVGAAAIFVKFFPYERQKINEN